MLYIEGEAVQGTIRNPKLKQRLQNLTGEPKYPAVLYLHGCDGLSPGLEKSFWDALARDGYAIVMPDELWTRASNRAMR